MKFKIICIALVMTLGTNEFITAQTRTNYELKSLNYVNLSESIIVTANPVQFKELNIKPSKKTESSIEVKCDQIINQNLSGIGGAFNEQGGEAFMSLSVQDRKSLAQALFNPTKGSGFSINRTAIGASDFGLNAYSYSETLEDYEMKHFSIERDLKSVVPFILAAKTENPSIEIFASPWSPPGWMKESGKMDNGAIKKEEGSDKKFVWVNNGKNYLRNDPKIYQAYALYFTKYIKAYAKHGVMIKRIAVQNETDMNTKYPSCDMSSEQMAELVFGYIQPAFNQAELNTEIWAGTFRGKRDDAAKFIEINGAKKIAGIAMQYASPNQVQAISKAGFAVMHSEGKCFNGKNTMEQARSRFNEISGWINSGSENYCYWNIILNEEGKSAWDWKQNSLVNIDRKTGKITYNPDYAPVSLLSKFIRPGDQSIKVKTPKGLDAIAVRNNKGMVVFMQNDDTNSKAQNIDIDGQSYAVELPAQSLCAFVFETKK